jgi:cob(I)alamin adenosyltransferase
MEDEEKEKLRQETCKNFFKAKACADELDMVVLDELAGAISDKLIDKEDVLRFILEFSQKKEIVITGRNLPQEIINAADYVSEIICVKHPFEQGRMAQKGIEY